jgi:hypothetical protein
MTTHPTIHVTLGAVDVIGGGDDWITATAGDDETRADELRTKAQVAYYRLAVREVTDELRDCYPDAQIELHALPTAFAPDRTTVIVDDENMECQYDIEGDVLRAEERAYELLFRDAVSDIIGDATEEAK